MTGTYDILMTCDGNLFTHTCCHAKFRKLATLILNIYKNANRVTVLVAIHTATSLC